MTAQDLQQKIHGCKELFKTTNQLWDWPDRIVPSSFLFLVLFVWEVLSTLSLKADMRGTRSLLRNTASAPPEKATPASSCSSSSSSACTIPSGKSSSTSTAIYSKRKTESNIAMTSIVALQSGGSQPASKKTWKELNIIFSHGQSQIHARRWPGLNSELHTILPSFHFRIWMSPSPENKSLFLQ